MSKVFMDHLLNINRFEARKFIMEQKDNMNTIEEIIVPALTDIGDGWQKGIYSLSQVYTSSVICESISEELFSKDMSKITQKLKIGIVTFDDYHTFGKKLVTLTLRSAGYQVADFGMIFNEDKLLEVVKNQEIDLLLISVLMLPPALRIKSLRPKLLEINPKIKIIVGGAPFRMDKNLYKEIGADVTGNTPNDALNIIREMEANLWNQ